MEESFRQLSGKLCTGLAPGEVLLLNYRGEESDFVRLNHNRIRQAGHVRQQTLHLDLIRDGREAAASLTLCADPAADLALAQDALGRLRAQLPQLPVDPHLNYATEVRNSSHHGADRLPEPGAALEVLMDAARGLDLVGIWAGGAMSRGFANSLGQFNWHTRHSFNLDWSIHLAGDKALKQNHAGFEWEAARVAGRIDEAREVLGLLGRKPKTLEPGRYRVFLAPRALGELLDLVGWGGFGMKSQRTAQSPLLAMLREGRTLHADVTLSEHHAAGLSPCFTPAGFIKPARVTLIENGVHREPLADRRSAKEYGAEVNCAVEFPQSLELDAGGLGQEDVLPALDSGIYLSDLWYANFSDRNHCRITGMTRYACLWVENGRAVAPVNVMRFDESLYRILGDRLEALTREREHLLDTGSYEWRSENGMRLPGALVNDFTLTF